MCSAVMCKMTYVMSYVTTPISSYNLAINWQSLEGNSSNSDQTCDFDKLHIT